MCSQIRPPPPMSCGTVCHSHTSAPLSCCVYTHQAYRGTNSLWNVKGSSSAFAKIRERDCPSVLFTRCLQCYFVILLPHRTSSILDILTHILIAVMVNLLYLRVILSNPCHTLEEHCAVKSMLFFFCIPQVSLRRYCPLSGHKNMKFAASLSDHWWGSLLQEWMHV